jgi:hypothetical protein
LGTLRYEITIADSRGETNGTPVVRGADAVPMPGCYTGRFIGMGGTLLEGLGHHRGWAFAPGRPAGRRAACRVVSEDVATGRNNE